MKIIITLFFLSLLFINPISAFVTTEEIEEFYGVTTAEVLKISYKEINIKLLKEGISYKEINNILSSRWEGGYIMLLLPPGEDPLSLELYDLKTENKERLVKYNDLDKFDECSNKYRTDKLNDTWVIMICPDNKHGEIEILVDALLYPHEVPEHLKKGEEIYGINADYYLNISGGVSGGIGEHLTNDFELKFNLLVDDSIVAGFEGVQCTDSCINLGLGRKIQSKGIYCYGHPNITKELWFTNIAIWGEDKEKYEKRQILKKEQEQNRAEWNRIIWVGVLFTLLIAIFRTRLSKMGDYIWWKYIKEKINKISEWWKYIKEKINKNY